MTPEELRQRELELEAEAELELENEPVKAPLSVYMDSEINTPQRVALSSSINAPYPSYDQIFTKNEYPYEKADIESRADALVREGIGGFAAENLKIGSTMMSPQLGVSGNIAKRLGTHGINALSAAGGYEVGNSIAEKTRLEPETSPQEHFNEAKANIAIGGGFPAAFDVASSAIQAGNRFLNTPERIASKWFGASKNQLNPESNKEIVGAVENLQKTPSDSILAQPSAKASYNELTRRRDIIGSQIANVYDQLTASGAMFDLGNLQNGRRVQDILQKARSIGMSDAEIAEINATFADFITRFQGRQKVLPSEAWEIVKKTEDGLNYGRDLSIEESLTQKVQKALSEDTRELLSQMKGAEKLSDLNTEYSAISDLAVGAGAEKGAEGKRGILSFLSAPLTLRNAASSAALATGAATSNPYFLVAGAAGLATEAINSTKVARSVYQLSSAAKKADPLMRDYGGRLAIAASSLLPRSSEALAEDPEMFSQAVSQYIETKFGDPILADAISSDIKDIGFNGNKMAQDELLKGLTIEFPDAFEPAPEGYKSFLNGKLTDLMEKDIHLRKAVDAKLSPRQRMEVIGGLLGNSEYKPINPSQNSTLMPQPQAIPESVDLETFSRYFPPVVTEDTMDLWQSTEGEDMIEKLNRSMQEREELSYLQ